MQFYLRITPSRLHSNRVQQTQQRTPSTAERLGSQEWENIPLPEVQQLLSSQMLTEVMLHSCTLVRSIQIVPFLSLKRFLCSIVSKLWIYGILKSLHYKRLNFLRMRHILSRTESSLFGKQQTHR